MRTRNLVLATAAGTWLAMAAARLLVPPRTTRRHQVEHLFPIDDPRFAYTMGVLLPPAYLGGNRILTLRNGDEAFPAMLEAIDAAEMTITLEVFIYLEGRIGYRLAEALARRARAGVGVYVLLDWLGSARINPESMNLLCDAGVQVRRCHRPPWSSLHAANTRTHRKILVVDGKIGFTGGINVADAWTGDATDPSHWRDMHYRIEGPVVAQLQQAFMDNWLKTHDRVLHGPEFFPPLQAAGDCLAQAFPGAPTDGSNSVRLMYAMALAAATRSVRLATSYFVPDDVLIQSMLAARRRSVEISIIVPGEKIDFNVVRYASRALWRPLLEAGVRIHEYQPAMYHCKAMIADERWVSVGSTNIDSRSFRLNDEVNLNVYDARFAGQQIDWFERDRERSRPVTLDQWRRRGLLTRAVDRAAATLRSQF